MSDDRQGRVMSSCTLVQVKAVEPDAVVIQAKGSDALERVEYGTCVWTTGVRMSPFTELLILKLEGTHRHVLLP